MKFVFFVIVLTVTKALAQNPGARLVAMGSGGTAIQDIWSLQQNPAGIAELKRATFALGYERHLLIPELSIKSALCIVPFRRNVLGFSFERYGIAEYQEHKIGISYARKFGDSFRLAIGVRYFQLHISQYGSAKALSVEAGFQLDVTENFSIASHIANPGGTSYLHISDLILPVKLSFGASFRFSEKVSMITDIRKELNFPIDVTTGIEYKLIKWFSLRGGTSVNPFKQYTGFGVSSHNIQLDFAVSSQPSLGFSPQISLKYEF